MGGWIGKVTAFFQGQLSPLSRVLIVAATLSILPAIVLPTWTITLHAPQYPQGLTLVIYPNTVSGDLSEVNILNHYIGMQEIVPDEFPEFRFIPFFILRFFGFALLTALIGRMPIAALGWMDFVLFGTVMLYTFQHWLYKYGHNLSADAPLKIQPFTPALLGTTEIGQFTVTSTPAAGAILMGLAGLIGPAIAIYEWRRYARASSSSASSNSP
jgi:copper chaperone NosL